MYNVILRCVRVTIIAVEKQQVLQYYVCVYQYSRPIYTACKSHLFYAVLYCLLWFVFIYYTFPHYITNGTVFGKQLSEIKCVL